MDEKLFAATFASQGEPYDEGVDYSNTLEPFESECTVGGADKIFAWTPKILRETLPDKAWCCQPYDEMYRIVNNGYHKVGLGAWRFVMINHMLKNTNDGDVVVFYDRRRYTGKLTKDLKRYVQKVIDVISPYEVYVPPHFVNNELVRLHTRKGVFDFLECDDQMKIKIANAPSLRAFLTVIKSSPKTRSFFQKLEDICFKYKEKILSGSPNEGFTLDGYYYYDHSCAEQSVLNVFGYADGIFPIDWKGSWIERCNNHGNADETGYHEMMAL